MLLLALAGLTVLAVAGPVERGVRPRCVRPLLPWKHGLAGFGRSAARPTQKVRRCSLELFAATAGARQARQWPATPCLRPPPVAPGVLAALLRGLEELTSGRKHVL